MSIGYIFLSDRARWWEKLHKYNTYDKIGRKLYI